MNVTLLLDRRTTEAPEALAPGRRIARLLPALVMVVVAAAVGYGLVVVFLHSVRGAALDQRMMDILSGTPGAHEGLHAVIRLVSPMTVAATAAVCVGVALLRGRLAIAAATSLLVLGATFTTQVLKHDVLHRVGSGINALPSGHSTAALLWALGAVLVVPRRLRPTVTVLGSVVACLVGVGTIVGRWHRPADVVAAAMVCLGWSAVAVSIAMLLGRRRPPTSSASVTTYAGVAVVATVVASAAFFVMGFHLNGFGLAKVGALVVLVSVTAVCATTVSAVAWLADRELA